MSPTRPSRGLTLYALIGLLAFFMGGAAHAASKVIVQNNTAHTVVFETSSTLSSKYWKKKSTSVKPFGRVVLFETNRDEGVKNGTTYEFTTKVQPKDPKTGNTLKQVPGVFELKLKLKGKPVGSHMWQSVKSQTGTQHAWHDDRKTHTASFNVEGKPISVRYHAYFTGGDDNVEYILRDEYPLPEGAGTQMSYEWNKAHLNVLSYNVYMRPTSLFKNGQMIRAKKIPDQLLGYDVIVLQEAFDDDVRAELLKGFTKKGYKHHSKILGKDSGAAQDGGVIVVSKWPIVKQAQRVFGNLCSGDDCLADKGVLYVKINKAIKPGDKNYFHVFGTHLNNGNFKIQVSQLEIIKNFINTRAIPKQEPVLIAGDMNIDLYDTAQFGKMLKTLDAGYFASGRRRGHSHTSDKSINDLGGGAPKYLDYVLYSKAHAVPTPASFAEVRIPRSHSSWKELPHESGMYDLSDHFAVYANYHFVYDPLHDWDPGVNNQGAGGESYCNEDADCPSGMRCEIDQPASSPKKPPAPSSSAEPPPPSVPAAGTATTQGRPSGTATTQGRPSGTAAKPRIDPKAALQVPKMKVYKGVCRVPPPK
jgi:endonuclease/exonuclease/phosphatase family metal-dependent hydrolase